MSTGASKLRPLEPGFREHRFSSDPFVDQTCREELVRFFPILLESLVKYRPRLAFLSGSAAVGEAVGISLPGEGIKVLSDLDLGVVTEFAVPPSHVLPSVSLPVEIGVGLYLRSELAKQQPTLGTLELRRTGVVVWGDGDLLLELPSCRAESIPALEAFRLVGNRALAVLKEPASTSASAVHCWAKFAGSLFVAESVLERRYESSWAERMCSIDTHAGNGPIDCLAREWGPFLSRPQLELIPPIDVELIRSGIQELVIRWGSRESIEASELADAYLGLPTTFRQRLREWRQERANTGFRWVVQSRLQSIPANRRLGLAAAYWMYGPERPDPVWGDETEPTAITAGDVLGWKNASLRLFGTELGTGAGTGQSVRSIVEGRSQ